ncbi:MAG TPA: T9SS type A sorting domain-containing protein [Candidatus Kapabacteria bacterium]|nr:T9SS type A sorting domain-containing protein [Candidatus Kapabacteria bacterium]
MHTRTQIHRQFITRRIHLYFFLSFVFFVSAHAQWKPTTQVNSSVFSLTVQGDHIYAGAKGQVFTSTDNGQDWTESDSGIVQHASTDRITAIGSNNNVLFAGIISIDELGGGQKHVYASTNNGKNWSLSDSGLIKPGLGKYTSFLFKGDSVFVSNDEDGIYLTTNNGTSWSASDSGLTGYGRFVTCMLKKDGAIYVGTYYGGVWASTNNGTSWTVVDSAIGAVTALTALDSTMIAGTNQNGLFISTNNGSTWTPKGPRAIPVYALITDSGRIFAGTDTGIFVSFDHGENWESFNDGLSNGLLSKLAFAFAIHDGYIFVANQTDTIWRRSLSDFTTDVYSEPEKLPAKFSLSQNYPDPFNPLTTIDFHLDAPGNVSLKIFDALGNETATLVNGHIEAGDHSVMWNAGTTKSGVYFCRLQIGSGTLVKQLVLVK